MRHFSKNLDPKGRVIRSAAALAIGASAVLLWPLSRGTSIVLAAASAFVAFEAARGWCALRACGVKTKF